MTQIVTIEGSMNPCSELPRGEQRTVVYSDRVKGLVTKGFVVVVDGPHDSAAQVSKGTGEPNVGHELPADGQVHNISLPGIEPETPLAQVEPTPYPVEITQDPVWPAADAAKAALHDHPPTQALPAS